MKAQADHSPTTTLGPFLRLILVLTSRHDTDAAENTQRLASAAQRLSDAAASDSQLQPERGHRMASRATSFGPFLRLLLTLHNRGTWIEREWWESSKPSREEVKPDK